MSEVKFEYMLEYRRTKVILTDHARTQASHRHGMPIESMKKWFMGAIDALEVCSYTPDYYNQEVFMYSKTMKRGMIVAFRRDFKNDNGLLCLVVVTVYPYGKDTPMQADTDIIRF